MKEIRKKPEELLKKEKQWHEKPEHRMKIRIKYPKFLLLVLTFIVAYFLFKFWNMDGLKASLESLGYLGTFICGMFFSYGFTAGPAVALFLILGDHQNILTAALVGGLGAVIGDYLIFIFLRTSFKDEINRFENEKIVKKVDGKIPLKLRHYLLMIFAELIITIPLPNEIGISLLAMDHHIHKKTFIAISFVLSVIGIGIILLIGKAI